MFLADLKMRSKLVVLLVVPVLGMLYFSSVGVMDKWHEYQEMKQLEDVAKLSVKISAMVHEIQKERGFTAGFLGSKGKNFSQELPNQRKEVDKKIRNLHAFLKEVSVNQFSRTFQETFSAALADLEKIENKRDGVSALKLPLKEALGYYTKMNSKFLNTIVSVSKLSSNAEVSVSIIAYANFLLSKERAGIERAVLTNTFAKNAFGPGMLNKFNTLVVEQVIYQNVFLNYASSEHAQIYREKMSSPEVAEVESMRNVALAKSSEGSFGIDPAVWFGAITKKIGLLKQMENQLSVDLEETVKGIESKALVGLTVNCIIGIIFFVLMVILAFVVMKNIVGPIQKSSDFLNDLTSSDVWDITKFLKIDSKDEIGVLAGSLNTFVKSIEDVIAKVKKSANDLASMSSKVSNNSLKISDGAQQQSAGFEELSSSVQANASNASKANEVTQKTAVNIEKTGENMENTIDAMNAIEKSAQQISEAVVMITDIADQTNLLALNAAIEAARAGEHGKGFAVVADEVRKLAENSASSARDITDLIKDSLKQVANGVCLSKSAGESLTKIVEDVRTVAQQLESISSATQQQATSMEENTLITETNASASSELASFSESLNRQAEGLISLISKFKVKEIEGEA